MGPTNIATGHKKSMPLGPTNITTCPKNIGTGPRKINFLGCR